MRIEPHYGQDTGMYLVDIYLESPRERALTHQEIWTELRPLLAKQAIEIDAVIDFFLHRRIDGGEWASDGQLSPASP